MRKSYGWTVCVNRYCRFRLKSQRVCDAATRIEKGNFLKFRALVCTIAVLFAGINASLSVSAASGTVAPPVPAAAADPTYSLKNDPEVIIGEKAAAQEAKQAKVLTSGPLWERVNRIGQVIAAAADKYPIPAMFGSSVLKQFHYTFHVVDNPDVNAFSLPGGFIYVNTGLLNFVHSDDELAAVLAHEIGHADHHHVITLMREQQKAQSILTPIQIAALAMILSHGNNDMPAAGFEVLQGSELYGIARINGYSVRAEEDADHTGMMLLTHTSFNPVAMYTFMVRLAAYERAHGDTNLGIYRDHPPTPQRIRAALAVIQQLNLPIRISQVDPTWQAQVKALTVNGQNVAQISIKDIVVCNMVAEGGQSAVQRATTTAKNLDYLVDRDLAPYEVRADTESGKVLARGITIADKADADAANLTIKGLSSEIGAAIVQVDQRRQMEFGVPQ